MYELPFIHSFICRPGVKGTPTVTLHKRLSCRTCCTSVADYDYQTDRERVIPQRFLKTFQKKCFRRHECFSIPSRIFRAGALATLETIKAPISSLVIAARDILLQSRVANSQGCSYMACTVRYI